jgi:hypothetical protein
MEPYDEVVKGLKQGVPIYKTLNRLGIHRSEFYKNITKEQKLELDLIRTSTKMFSGLYRTPSPYMKEFEPIILDDDE